MHIGIVSTTKLVSDSDISWMVRAISEQAKDFAKDCNLAPWPVLFYKSLDDLPYADEVRPIVLCDDPNEFLGYHNYLAGADYIYGRVFCKVIFDNGGKVLGGSDINVSDVLSHECLEMKGNPYITDYALGPQLPEGRWYAKEASDAVQRDIYQATSRTLWGTSQTVSLSNYLLPSWFSDKGGPPFDKLGRLVKPFSMSPGGYMIVKDDLGNQNEVYGDVKPPAWLMDMKHQIGARTQQLAKKG